MANKYSGTKTEENLRTAFSGESQARNKYTYFASKAKKDGFEQIADLFLKTADNESEQRQKILFRRQRAKIMNGQICMLISQKLPKKKALPNWLKSSVW